MGIASTLNNLAGVPLAVVALKQLGGGCQGLHSPKSLDEVVGGLARTRWDAHRDSRSIRIRYKRPLEFKAEMH